MIKMDRDPLDLGSVLGKGVEPLLHCSPVIAIAPIISEFSEITRISSILPTSVVVRRIADHRVGDAARNPLEPGLRYFEAERYFHCRVIRKIIEVGKAE